MFQKILDQIKILTTVINNPPIPFSTFSQYGHLRLNQSIYSTRNRQIYGLHFYNNPDDAVVKISSFYTMEHYAQSECYIEHQPGNAKH